MPTIATWNLNKPVSPKRQDEMLRLVAEMKADVWVFTETHDSFTERLKSQLAFQTEISSIAGRDGNFKQEHRWVTICSKHKIEREATTDQKRTAAARVYPDGASTFLIFGTVLPWHGDNWQGCESAGGVAYAKALELQSSDWKCLHEKYPDDEFFVAGDFNQDLVDKPRYYGSVKNRTALEDALDAAKLRALTGGNADPVRSKSKDCACIDHICCRIDSRWNIKETIRWPDTDAPLKWLSDHFGIAVVLE